MFRIILMLIAGPLFLISLAAHFYVKIAMKPKDGEIDEYHFEFEDHHPDLARYNKWSHITFTAAIIGALLLFLSIAI